MNFFPQQLGSGIFKLFSGNRLISSQLTILFSYYYYDFSMFAKLLALFLFPALAASQYGPPPGPAAPASGSASATSSALAVAPTAPPNANGEMNVCASFLACSDTYVDKFTSRLMLRSIRCSYLTLQILRHLMAQLWTSTSPSMFF